MTEKRKIRVLIAKPGLDGHDRGAKVVVYALREAGMEVIYTGLHQTAEEIANTALQEDIDCIGLSVLSGAHLFLCEELTKKMKELEIADVPVIIGGIIPEKDVERLKEIGIKVVFGSGTSLETIKNFVEKITLERTEAGA